MTFETKKKIAEIFAGVIPCQMARNRWRGLLRYGVFRLVGLMWRVRKMRLKQPRHYLSVCAIAKNEGCYFPEWLEWHKAHGVERFYIYDNDSTDDTATILAPYVASGLVEYIFYPGPKMQIPAYDDCIDRHRWETRWLAFIDLDEFIVPLKTSSIPDFLRPLERFPVVEINWLVYGSGGAKTREKGGVMERFTLHSLPDDPLNRHVKSVVDPRRVACMTGCHEAARMPFSGAAVNSDGVKNRKNYRNREPVQTTIRINHYAVKSYEEFLEKRARGRARRLDLRDMGYFTRYDLNDLDD